MSVACTGLYGPWAVERAGGTGWAGAGCARLRPGSRRRAAAAAAAAAAGRQAPQRAGPLCPRPHALRAVCRRVQSLFHSVQLNVNNPHFLIMQGRITKVGVRGGGVCMQRLWLAACGIPAGLCAAPANQPQPPANPAAPPTLAPPQVLNMKPPEILGLLEEAAGTKMYEDKRRKALATLLKKQAKVDEINKVRGDCGGGGGGFGAAGQVVECGRGGGSLQGARTPPTRAATPRCPPPHPCCPHSPSLPSPTHPPRC